MGQRSWWGILPFNKALQEQSITEPNPLQKRTVSGETFQELGWRFWLKPASQRSWSDSSATRRDWQGQNVCLGAQTAEQPCTQAASYSAVPFLLCLRIKQKHILMKA